jgi:hypothetical protein
MAHYKKKRLAKRLLSSQEGICYMAATGRHFVYVCGQDTAKSMLIYIRAAYKDSVCNA